MRISDWSSDVCSSDLHGELCPICAIGCPGPARRTGRKEARCSLRQTGRTEREDDARPTELPVPESRALPRPLLLPCHRHRRPGPCTSLLPLLRPVVPLSAPLLLSFLSFRLPLPLPFLLFVPRR